MTCRSQAGPVDRSGGHVEPADRARICVILAQWRRLEDLGGVRRAGWVDADTYAYRRGGKARLEWCTTAELDRAIRMLGREIRAALALGETVELLASGWDREPSIQRFLPLAPGSEVA